jgi:LPS sulfotransferase NodH
MMDGSRPIRCFAIFGSGRSGSRLLVDLLNSHPSIFCEYGMFLDGEPDHYRWLASRVELASQGAARAYGIRLLVPQMADDAGVPDLHGFLQHLQDDGWQIIHLCRLSPVRVVLSYVHAARNGFHLAAGETSWRYKPMTLSREEVSHWIDAAGRWLAGERDALRGVAAHRLIYERDLATEQDQQATVNRISGWLGLPAAKARANVRRQMPDRPLSELIANYSEIKPLLDEFSRAFPRS